MPIQALLLFWNLDLLPVWTDELFTLETIPRPVSQILPILQRDIHPPLYYLLLHFWPGHTIAAVRAFSGLWTLLSTVLLDRLWLARWSPRRRAITLALFTLSPCLLLYGRMGRSYAMQTALSLAAVCLLWRWFRARRGAPQAALACLALLYTHYVPAIAILTGFAVTGVRRIPLKNLLAFYLALGAGYAPWLFTLSYALGKWGEASGFSSNYSVTGIAAVEQTVKFGFGAISFAIGESFSGWSLLLVPVVFVFAWRGVRILWPRWRHLVLFLAIAAALGYLGVAHWVSYPFIPARLLWLFPFLVLSFVIGSKRRLWPAALLLVSSMSGIYFYFRQENYMNKGYAAPLRELAARLESEAGPSDLILIDGYNTDGNALLSYYRGSTPAIVLGSSQEVQARTMLASARNRFFIRNTHDISPGWLTTRLETEACKGRLKTIEEFVSYQPWQRAAMRFISIPGPPRFFYRYSACTLPHLGR